MATLLNTPDPPDAVAAMSDEQAAGVIRAARAAGLRVPDDVAVTGWDDAAIASDLGISTVAQSLRDQGAECARVVLGEESTTGEAAPWSLAIRSSTRGGGAAESDVVAQVLAAAEARADALAAADAARLGQLLHPEFHWVSHRGEHFDRDGYLHANTEGPTQWRSQVLVDPQVTVVDEVAVLRCTVLDSVSTDDGPRIFRMPMTQVWVRAEAKWLCLTGHAGPLQEPAGPVSA
jgi:hypothetical protein